MLRTAHMDIEGVVLDREVRRLRDMLAVRFSEIIYNGASRHASARSWFRPEFAVRRPLPLNPAGRFPATEPTGAVPSERRVLVQPGAGVHHGGCAPEPAGRGRQRRAQADPRQCVWRNRHAVAAHVAPCAWLLTNPLSPGRVPSCPARSYVMARESPNSLYDSNLASMDIFHGGRGTAEGGQGQRFFAEFNPSDSDGFIKINSVRLRAYHVRRLYQEHREKTQKHDAPGTQ